MSEADRALDPPGGENPETATATAPEKEESPREAPPAPDAPLATIAMDASASAATPVATTTTTTVVCGSNIDNIAEGEEASSALSTNLKKERLRGELELYMSGNEIDASPCYAALEGVFRNPEISEMDQDARNGLLQTLLSCVEGERLCRQPQMP